MQCRMWLSNAPAWILSSLKRAMKQADISHLLRSTHLNPLQMRAMMLEPLSADRTWTVIDGEAAQNLMTYLEVHPRLVRALVRVQVLLCYVRTFLLSACSCSCSCLFSFPCIKHASYPLPHRCHLDGAMSQSREQQTEGGK